MGGYGIRFTCELDVAEIMCVPIVTLASNRNLTHVFIKIVFPKCGDGEACPFHTVPPPNPSYRPTWHSDVVVGEAGDPQMRLTIRIK